MGIGGVEMGVFWGLILCGVLIQIGLDRIAESIKDYKR